MQKLLPWIPMLILELLPPTMFILSRSNGGQVAFCSQHFEKHGKLNTCFSGQGRSVSVPGWVCSLQEQKKIICYSSSNGLMCSFFMFWCWLLLASAFSLPPSSTAPAQTWRAAHWDVLWETAAVFSPWELLSVKPTDPNVTWLAMHGADWRPAHTLKLVG